MKRFYCTVCRKVKRVRKYPRIIQDAQNIAPAARVGQCNHHHNTPSPAVFNRAQMVGQSRKVAQ